MPALTIWSEPAYFLAFGTKCWYFTSIFGRDQKKMLNLAISQVQHLFKVATHEIVLSWMTRTPFLRASK